MQKLTKEVCVNYRDPTNSNFYFLNAHGEELEADYIIPKGVRIIMFCYSGAILDVCKKFDKFNWTNILLDPNASSNYCTFLSAISKYSSIRDHFCIYEEGDTIKNIQLYSDNDFREGLFRLPVKGFAHDIDTNSVVISSGTLLSDVQKDSRLKKIMKQVPTTHIKVDDKKVVELMRKKNDVGIISSYIRTIHSKISLSNLINSRKMDEPNFTMLLMVCREGIGSYDISDGKKVKDELAKLYRKINLDNIMRQ